MIISVRDLNFAYPTKRALSDISFDIPAGSITAMVGPNGAGKTTLLRCLAGLDTPYHGSVNVAGVDVLADPREAHRRIGYLRDLFGLYDELTIRQCLMYQALANNLPRKNRHQAVEDVAAQLNLTDRLEQTTGTLSRGLRQRVAIGQTIIHKPTVILLDEPASGLDPEARSSLSTLLLRLREEGMTLVVSSHILAELEDYSTHMMIVRGGRVLDFSAIENAATRTLKRLYVQLAAMDAPAQHGLLALLGDYAGVSDSVATATGAAFGFSGDAAAQHRLLTAMLAAGLPVHAFGEIIRSMQDVYFEKLGFTPTGSLEAAP